jgi:hypothetical protein
MKLAHFSKISRDAILATILLAALFAVTVYGAAQQSPEENYPPGSIYSRQPTGARALKVWLDELGYETTTLEGGRFFPDETVDLILLLSPSEMLAENHVSILERWVRQGGTLVYAGDDFFVSNQLLEKFELDFEWLEQPVERLALIQPALDATPVRDARVNAQAAWKPRRNDYVTHMAAAGKPALISFRYGEGQVFAITSVEPFTNEGLQDAGNAALVQNLILAGAGRAGQVAFDEYHHGFQETPSIRTWLVSSRTGWAVLYSLLAVFAFLVVSGRRFGQPVPLPEHIARRTTAEYIHALANLKRRAGRRQTVLTHYKDRLKRHLGRACGIDPSLNDDLFVYTVTQCRPELDAQDLTQLLANLSRSQVSERDMVRLAEQATRWLA